MSMLSVEKALRVLRQTPIILEHTLKNVTQQHAQQATDGIDGWNILYVVCHLHDYEHIYYERVQITLAQDNPHLPVLMSNAEMSIAHAYAEQNMRQTLNAYLTKRQEFIALLESLTDQQWARRGVHPTFGEYSVLDFAINTGLHDVNHTEQIIKSLKS